MRLYQHRAGIVWRLVPDRNDRDPRCLRLKVDVDFTCGDDRVTWEYLETDHILVGEWNDEE